jgi:RNA:NAD 2'-phosphotransferase (TPT1/KptA family)
MPKEKRIVFRIDESLYETFKEICEKNDKSVSKVLRNYIDKVVENDNKNI